MLLYITKRKSTVGFKAGRPKKGGEKISLFEVSEGRQGGKVGDCVEAHFP